MALPGTVDEILKHAEELAARFEDYEPNRDDELDSHAVALLRTAVGFCLPLETEPEGGRH